MSPHPDSELTSLPYNKAIMQISKLVTSNGPGEEFYIFWSDLNPKMAAMASN
jgi:hypothetical protein